MFYQTHFIMDVSFDHLSAHFALGEVRKMKK